MNSRRSFVLISSLTLFFIVNIHKMNDIYIIIKKAPITNNFKDFKFPLSISAFAIYKSEKKVKKMQSQNN